jgi:TrmH family RNA methyltransferase
MENWKDNISFVLVGAREGGNIGASARALKNMGFSRLELAGVRNFPSEEAQWFAHGAEDVLTGALVHKSLEGALKGKALVVGTTRRVGKKRGETYPIKAGVKKIREAAQNAPVAILFGREDRGLTNEETDRCAFLINIKIPGERRPPSINLAQAVLLVAYELSFAREGENKKASIKGATHEELSFFFARAEGLLKDLSYKGKDRDIMLRNAKNLLGRSGIAPWELQMLHGLISRIEKRAK